MIGREGWGQEERGGQGGEEERNGEGGEVKTVERRGRGGTEGK